MLPGQPPQGSIFFCFEIQKLRKLNALGVHTSPPPYGCRCKLHPGSATDFSTVNSVHIFGLFPCI